MNNTVITIFTDGGARGNPGPAAAGVWSPEIGEFNEYLGTATNNQAEYHALWLALVKVLEYTTNHPEVEELKCFLDSELIVKQMKREYKVKNKELQKYFLKIHNLVTELKAKNITVSFTHVPREQNKEADRMVNEAIDEALGL